MVRHCPSVVVLPQLSAVVTKTFSRRNSGLTYGFLMDASSFLVIYAFGVAGHAMRRLHAKGSGQHRKNVKQSTPRAFRVPLVQPAKRSPCANLTSDRTGKSMNPGSWNESHYSWYTAGMIRQNLHISFATPEECRLHEPRSRTTQD